MAWSAQQKFIDNKKKNLDSKMRFSAWTPMSDPGANEKVFEERRALLNKWLEKWNDNQKKKILTDIMQRCSVSQLQHAQKIMLMRLPVEKEDFTRSIPRALSLYIFSFLDPRSLCRCSQVCWFWKYLTELDQLWMPKALKLGWYLTFTPSPCETGVWKRLYLENVRSLNYISTKDSSNKKSSTKSPKTEEDKKNVKKPEVHKTPLKAKPPKPLVHKPWRGTDPKVEDIYRNNYLDNSDSLLDARQKRQEKMKSTKMGRSPSYDGNLNQGHERKTSSSSPINVTSYKLKKSKSISNLDNDKEKPPSSGRSTGRSSVRPAWAQKNAGDTTTAETISGQDATIRPKPVRNVSPVRASNAYSRTERDVPSGALFPTHEWRPLEATDYSSDDER
ncbi:F-box only protein 16 [Holothuria leucospilota]|uniref:F-box only protein 16 n=1 Tax=Holothuria leucospilota TaxID=206669 RepID=A0A9Q0YKQ1_HOLLE|nr:F-box only protein 16 [Holothuria leucospilota]